MSNLRIGIRTTPLGLPLRAALSVAGRLGADGVELDLRDELPLAELSQTGLREVRKLLDDQRLRVAAVRFPTRRGLGDPNELDRRVAAIERAMQLGYELGARVINLSGAVQTTDATAAANPALRESLARLSRHSERIGMQVALQPASIEIEAAEQLVADYPETMVGWAIDSASLVAQGLSVAETIAPLARRCLHVYASDGYRDFSSRQFVRTQLGRGTVDLGEMMGILDGAGYRGWCVVEGAAEGDMQSSLNDSIAYLRNL